MQTTFPKILIQERPTEEDQKAGEEMGPASSCLFAVCQCEPISPTSSIWFRVTAPQNQPLRGTSSEGWEGSATSSEV